MAGPQLPSPLWFVGCGNMGSAMVAGWRSAGIDLGAAVVIRPSGTGVEGIRTVRTFAEAGPPPKLVVLAMKPQQIDSVAADLKPWLTSKTAIVSILAGIEVESLRERFPKAGPIIRAMPNLPVEIRRGVVALYGEPLDDALRRQIGDAMSALGYAIWAADESRFAAIGAVAGAGPAYVARFVAALAHAGEQRGLSSDIAKTIALETVLGTAWMAATDGEAMDSLAQRVASPKGTTEAGLAVLDPTLDELVGKAIAAAATRGQELAEDAKSRA